MFFFSAHVSWRTSVTKAGAFTTVSNSAESQTWKRCILRNCSKKMAEISQFDVAPLCLILSPLLACDPGLPEILINVSCFPTLTCPTPVLTLTISQPTVPHTSSWNSSSWAENYFPMFNNSTSPHPQTQYLRLLYTSEECPRPLMRSRFPNAKTLFNRFLLPQSPSSEKNLVTNGFSFHFHWSRAEISFLIFRSFGKYIYRSRCWWNPPPGFLSPNFQQFLAPSPDYRGRLRRFVPIIPNSLRTPAAKVCHALFELNSALLKSLAERDAKLLSALPQNDAESE